MSTHFFNDISKIYQEQILESTVPGKPAERVGALTNIDIPKSEQEAARARILAKTKAKRNKITESHFKVGDEVICKASGMEGEVVKVDPEERGKYYTVEREDGKKVKYAPDELKLEDEEEEMKEEKDPFGRPGGKYGGVPKKGGGYDRGYQAMQKKLKELDKAKTEALDPVGQEDADIDNDGDIDKSDKYLHTRRKAIGNAISKKKKMKEGFSNWRQDLSEVMGDIEASKGIEKKNVKIKEREDIENTIKINPELGEAVEEIGGTLLEMVSIDEEYLYETVDIASNYFYEQGLNESGVEILIEELGDEEFVSFVHDIREEIALFEARAGGIKVEPVTKTGKQVGSLKGGARTSAIKRLRKEKQARREAEARTSSEKPSGMKAALQRQSAMSSAKKQQKPTPQGRTRRGTRRGALDRIAGAVLSGMERHRKATAAASKMAKQTGETLRRAAPVARKAASEFGKGFTSGVKTAGKAAKDVKKTVSKEELELQEKPFDVYDTRRNLYLAKGLKTRKGAKRRSDREDERYGAITTKVIPTGDDRPEIKYKTKKEEIELRKFAKTKHKGLPEKVKESMDQIPMTPGELNLQRKKK